MTKHAPSAWTGPHPSMGETKRTRDLVRAEAIRLLTDGQQTIYAARLSDGTIKIGCTGDLAARRRMIGVGVEILGFMPGDFTEEQAIHQTLKAHRARGWEYYHPTPAVLAVVNEMRDHFGLPHLDP